MPRLTQKFRPRPGHIAVCHAFGAPLDRRQALAAPYRAELMAEHRAMAQAFETLAATTGRFAETLSNLDAEKPCNLALQSNVLLMSSQARAGLSTRYSQARQMEPMTTQDGTLQARLIEPISLPHAVNTGRFEALQALRKEVYDLIQNLCDRLTRLYYDTPKMTIGELERTLREISHNARGLTGIPVSEVLPLPVAA